MGAISAACRRENFTFQLRFHVFPENGPQLHTVSKVRLENSKYKLPLVTIKLLQKPTKHHST